MRKVQIDKNFNEALKRDPIAEVEQVLNKHHSEFDRKDGLMMLSNAFHVNKQKSDYLKSLGDTHFGTKWDEFIDIIESNGFIVGLKYDFKHDEYTDEAALYYHPQKGLVIWATSYFNKSSLNGGEMYGEVKTNEKVEYETIKNHVWNTEYKQIQPSETLKKGFESLNGCSHDALSGIETGVTFKYDVREALINKIEQIGDHLVFVNEWTEKPFLWFLDYTEEKIDGYDYKEITKDKIGRCPEELQQILKVYMK